MFFLFLALIFFCCSAATETSSPNDVLVRLSLGEVRGTTLISEKGEPFYAFRGIPYAEPPTGELRFKAPIPKRAWGNETVFDATKDGPVCFQEDSFVRKAFVGQEDCLNLNVYTPKLPQNNSNNDKKSVMIFIHGGGFMLGDGTSAYYPPGRLMDSDIVLVTINYRLDALGFLSTEDSASPGNYGLIDQTLAFQWVQDNIEAFGGNKHSVTIFGESAGGASVSFHLISPLSKGLFHRAIAMSGSDLAPYALVPDAIFWAKHLATHAQCPQNSTSDMIKCFRSKPVKDLVLGQGYYGAFSSFPVPFQPVVDGHFLPAPPRNILTYSPEKINNVTVLAGTTEMETAAMVSCKFILLYS